MGNAAVQPATRGNPSQHMSNAEMPDAEPIDDLNNTNIRHGSHSAQPQPTLRHRHAATSSTPGTTTLMTATNATSATPTTMTTTTTTTTAAATTTTPPTSGPQGQGAPTHGTDGNVAVQQLTFRERAVAGAMGLGIVTAAVGGTYLLSDTEVVVPFAIAACLATAVSSMLLRFALTSMIGPRNRPRGRHFRHHRHFSGERAEYARTSQRLAMMDRDFTDADYEMLLDLDNHSQRLRRFLEGASEDEVNRLPLFEYMSSKKWSATQPSKPVDNVLSAMENENQGQSDKGLEISFEKEDTVSEETSLTGASARKCMICLEDFEDGMMIRMLPCFHRFMAECVDHWLTHQAKCPVCKRSIREDFNLVPSDC